MATLVKDFKIEPSPVPLGVREFSFRYVDKDKKREYKVKSQSERNLRDFQAFVFAIMACQKKNLLPWTMKAVQDLKDKVTIIPIKDKEEPKKKPEEAIQMELPLKVAKRFVAESCENNLS